MKKLRGQAHGPRIVPQARGRGDRLQQSRVIQGGGFEPIELIQSGTAEVRGIDRDGIDQLDPKRRRSRSNGYP